MEKAKISSIDFADFQCTTDDRIGQELSVRVKLSKNVPFGLVRVVIQHFLKTIVVQFVFEVIG